MIKNLIYLDEQKMYSLSSQIFEGITEYILNESQKKEEESESQKGPMNSGRIVADVITTISNHAEKKYLHDYSYLLFEKELIDREQVLILNNQENTETAENKSFIKISAKATFHDIQQINYLMENIGNLAESLAYINTGNPQITEHKSAQRDPKGFQSSRNTRKKKTENQKKNIVDQGKQMMGLNYDQTYFDHLSSLINYGFQDQLEIQQKINNSLYSAFLKRECLREDEKILIKKYSRKTGKELVVFGIITQSQSSSTDSLNELEPYPSDNTNIKESMMYLVEQLTNIEQQFSGKLVNEFVIDPIAIYTEL